MATQQEQASIKLIIDKTAASASVVEVTQQIKYLQAAIQNMRKEDDPALYQSRINQLEFHNQVLAQQKNAINNNTIAQEKFKQEFTQGMNQLEGSSNSFMGALGNLRGMIGSLGIAALLKEMIGFASKSSGIEQAFSKLGNTEGLLEKMRVASRGLITDLDLEKIAIKANNANIPLDKMGVFLQFASQRARDTGEDVTALTEKLITGLAKGGTRSLAALGISTKEVKTEFKKTGDMVEAVSNIIQRQMQRSGTDVETFGDRIGGMITKAKNAWQGFTDLLSGFLFKDLAKTDEIDFQKNNALKKLGVPADLTKMTDAQLKQAIAEQQKNVESWKKVNDEAQHQYALWHGDTGDLDASAKFIREHPKLDDEKINKNASQYAGIYQGNRDANSALLHEQDRRTSASDAASQAAAPGEKKAEAEREATLKAFQELAEQRKLFEESELAGTMAKNQKEIAELEKTYDTEIVKYQDFLKKKGVTKKEREDAEQQIDSLNTEKQKAVVNLRAKQEKDLADKISQYRAQLAGKMETELQKEVNSINQKFDELKKNAGDNAKDLETIETGREQAIADASLRDIERLKQMKAKLDEDHSTLTGNKDENSVATINKKYDEELMAFKKTNEEKIANYKEYTAVIEQIEQNRQAALAKRERDIQRKEIDAGIQAAQSIANAVFQISANNRNTELNAKVKQLEDERTAALANTNLTQAQQAAINQQYDEQEKALKLQAWKADQKAAEEQAIINGALAITKAFAEGGVLGFITAGLVALETAAQIAVITSQQPPQFAAGGVIKGPSHAEGGVDLVIHNTGQRIGNMEGGEPIMVLSKETQQNNGPLISELLHNSMYKNGAAVNTNGISHGIQAARGAVFSNQATSSTSATRQSLPAAITHQTDLSETNQLLRDLHGKFDDFSKKPWTFPMRQFYIEDAKNKSFQNNANG